MNPAYYLVDRIYHVTLTAVIGTMVMLAVLVIVLPLAADDSVINCSADVITSGVTVYLGDGQPVFHMDERSGAITLSLPVDQIRVLIEDYKSNPRYYPAVIATQLALRVVECETQPSPQHTEVPDGQ